MATNTYTALQTQVLGSSASSVTFSSIPQGYTDLVLVAYANGTGAGFQDISVRVGNGSVDTGTNYSWTDVYGTGSAAGSYRNSNVSYCNLGYINGTTVGSTSYSFSKINFMNYSNTTTYKTMLSPSFVSIGDSINSAVGLWRSTAAINIITLFPNANNFSAGSTFTLYAVQAA